MSKKNIIILIISILMLVMAFGVFLYSKHVRKNPNAPENQPASNSEEQAFHFYDYDKNSLSLNDFSDKPSVILFWKSDDSNSYDIISLLEQYYEEYKDKVNLFGINVNEPDIDYEIVDNVKAARFKIPMYFDTDLLAKDEFNYEVLPYLAFIDTDGNVVNDFSVTITEDQFLANLELLK